MNAMDLPAPPPRWGNVMTRSEMASSLVPVFQDRASDIHHLALFIDAAMDRLMKYGLTRPWGVDAKGRVLFSAEEMDQQTLVIYF